VIFNTAEREAWEEFADKRRYSGLPPTNSFEEFVYGYRAAGHKLDNKISDIKMKTIHIRISSPSEESAYIVYFNDNKQIAKVEYTGYLNGGGAGEVGEIELAYIPSHVKKAVEIMLEGGE